MPGTLSLLLFLMMYDARLKQNYWTHITAIIPH
jgi:hypothetical protein